MMWVILNTFSCVSQFGNIKMEATGKATAISEWQRWQWRGSSNDSCGKVNPKQGETKSSLTAEHKGAHWKHDEERKNKGGKRWERIGFWGWGMIKTAVKRQRSTIPVLISEKLSCQGHISKSVRPQEERSNRIQCWGLIDVLSKSTKELWQSLLLRAQVSDTKFKLKSRNYIQ